MRVGGWLGRGRGASDNLTRKLQTGRIVLARLHISQCSLVQSKHTQILYGGGRHIYLPTGKEEME